MNDRTQMTVAPPRVVVVIVTFNCAAEVGPCLDSLSQAELGALAASIIVVDNASSDGTAALVRERSPSAELIVNETNVGFAAAVNRALRLALARGAEFVFLLNPDTRADARFLERSLDLASTSERIAAVQSLLLLAPDGERIDSAGNALQFLGFGYCRSHGRPRSEAPRVPLEVAFASGAATLLRCAALREVGLLDEALFLYCEDLDLGWRLRRAGYSVLLAPDSIVIHAHDFSRHPNKHFLLERNRWLVLLRNWSARSLAVLAIPLLLNELAMVGIAWRQGWLRAKLRSFATFVRAATWSRLRTERRAQRALRRVGDRALAERMTPRMEVDGTESAFLRFVANPLLGFVWAVAKRLL